MSSWITFATTTALTGQRPISTAFSESTAPSGTGVPSWQRLARATYAGDRGSTLVAGLMTWLYLAVSAGHVITDGWLAG